jgi:4-coumarate--CoA ligase
VATKERLTFHDVKRKAEILSTILICRYGLQPDQTVTIFSGNSIWYPVGVWATIRAGGRVNGASPGYNVAETEHALRTASTKILLTLPGSLEVAREAAARVGIPESNIMLLEGEAQGVASMQRLIAEAEHDVSFQIKPTWRIPAGKNNKDVCGYLNFSSGTTGLPKAVMLSHGNIIAQCYQLRQLQVLSKPEASSSVHPHGLPEYRILAVMPLFHITGLVRFVSYPVLMSGLSAMLPSFTMPSMLKAIIRYKIDELILVPPILIRLVHDSVVDPYLADLQQIVRRWSSGSAPIAPEVIKALQRKFPETGFRQGYGATESTACISAHPPSHFDYKYAHTGGMLVANTIAKVVALAPPEAEPGKSTAKEVLLGPREIGEICAKGPQICMGYLNNEVATREAFDEEGYLHTGDVGYIDDEGLIVISDRIKEMIKVRGQQVAPAELEDLLLGHELVEDCAVIGIKDNYSGELPKGFVVLKDRRLEGDATGLKLLSYIRQRVVGYKRIREIEFVDGVPKSATGKLLRRVLKGWERGEDSTRVQGTVVREHGKKTARL